MTSSLTFFDFALSVEKDEVLNGSSDFSNRLSVVLYPNLKELSRSKFTAIRHGPITGPVDGSRRC